MKEIHVADNSRSQRDGSANGKPVERPRDYDAGPGRAVACDNVGDGGEKRARHDNGPATGGAREGHDEQWPDAREHEVHNQLVRCLDGRDSERSTECDEGRVGSGGAHGPEERQDRDLEADCQLQGWVPVLTEVRVLDFSEWEEVDLLGDHLCVYSAEETAAAHVCPTGVQVRLRQSWSQHLLLSHHDGSLASDSGIRFWRPF